MMLHTSTALSKNAKSHQALWRFMLALSIALTAVLALFWWQPLYTWLFVDLFGTSPDVSKVARPAFLLMILWPFSIAWRRFFQGLLIRFGRSKQVGWASLMRLAWIAVILTCGVFLKWNGALLAGIALAGGVAIEALLVTFFARGLRKKLADEEPTKILDDAARSLPVTTSGVMRFYAPLALTMLLVWGGRAMLVSLVARAGDGMLALAAWPAAWGFVLSVANATRMVQQLVILHEHDTPHRELLKFTAIVGSACSLVLALLCTTPPGQAVLGNLLANKDSLLGAVLSVLQVAIVLPLLVAFQNALQGFLIRQQRTWRINQATFAGLAVTICVTWILVRNGCPGALAAGWGMVSGFSVEVLFLSWTFRSLGLNRTIRI